MIPKIIHYCWFGGNPLPELAIKCIESWKKYLPDYEIKEWNESNFDLACCDYVKEAYQSKKWAFVSDYARFWILYNYGGLYFDTDVEIIKDMTSIIVNGAFMGCETVDKCAPGLGLGVNPGLGLGVNPGLGLYDEILKSYERSHFIKENGEIDCTPIVDRVTDILIKHGFIEINEVQKLDDITIYPPRYFSPLDYETGRLNLSEETVSIHHYSESWHSNADKIITKISRKCINKYGEAKGKKVSHRLSLPFRVISKFEKLGIKNTVIFIKKKYFNKYKK